VVASARLLRASTSALYGAPAHAFERDMGAWAIEWLALPQALILAGGLLEKLAHVLEGLDVDPARMRANLELTQGSIMAEAAMMALARSLGHERAHELVAAASKRAAAEGRDLGSVLAEVADEPLPLDPERYLGLAGAAVDAVRENPGS
jgi:3-carboxy-cis,cis-muconate cycloisomerase